MHHEIARLIRLCNHHDWTFEIVYKPPPTASGKGFTGVLTTATGEVILTTTGFTPTSSACLLLEEAQAESRRLQGDD